MGKQLDRTMWAVIRIHARSESIICVSYQRNRAIWKYNDMVDVSTFPELGFYYLKSCGEIRVANVKITEVV